MNYFAMFDKTTDADGKEVYRYRGADWGEYKGDRGAVGCRVARAQLAQLYIDYLSQFTGESIPMYLAYISSYERIRVLADRLLACGNEDILRNYYYLPLGEKQDGDTLYAGVYDAEGNFTRYLTLLGINMEEYSKADNLRAFLRNNTDYFWSAVELVYPQIANPGTRFTFDDAHVNALMESFRALSPDERYLLLTVDSLNIYYGGLEAYYASIFSDSEAEKNRIGTAGAGDSVYLLPGVPGSVLHAGGRIGHQHQGVPAPDMDIGQDRVLVPDTGGEK